MPEAEIKTVTISQSEKVTSSNGEYRKVHYSDGKYNNCFAKNLFDKLDGLVGRTAQVKVVKKGRYYNIEDAWEAGASETKTKAKSFSREIDDKDFLIVKQSQMSNAVNAIAPFYHAEYNDESNTKTLTKILEEMENDIKITWSNLVKEVWGRDLNSFLKEETDSPKQEQVEPPESENDTEEDGIPF